MNAPTPPSWENLLTLMVDGPADEPAVHGVLRSQLGRDPGHGSVGWAGIAPVFAGAHLSTDTDQATDTSAGTGNGQVQSLWAWRDGRRVRLEELDGTPSLIVGDEFCWVFDAPPRPPLRAPAHLVQYLSAATDLLTRIGSGHGPTRDEVPRLIGPITGITFLDRPAWAIELAAPPRHAYPEQLVVDAATGLVLQRRIDALGAISEWTELTVTPSLPGELFTYDGDYRTRENDQAQMEAEHLEDGRRRSAWFTRNVATLPLRIELNVGVWVHEYDEQTGAFQASFGERHLGMIARRPADAAGDWELHWGSAGHRWSDDRWQWAVVIHHDELTEESFAALRAQLCAGPDIPE